MQKYLHVWKEIDILHSIFKKISWPKYSVRFLFCNRLLFLASLTGVNGRRRVLLLLKHAIVIDFTNERGIWYTETLRIYFTVSQSKLYFPRSLIVKMFTYHLVESRMFIDHILF